MFQLDKLSDSALNISSVHAVSMLFRDFMSDFNCFILNLKSAEKIVKQLLKPLKKVASIVCFQDCV